MLNAKPAIPMVRPSWLGSFLVWLRPIADKMMPMMGKGSEKIPQQAQATTDTIPRTIPAVHIPLFLFREEDVAEAVGAAGFPAREARHWLRGM